MQAVGAKAMKELDKIAENSGIPTLVLMENAGKEIAKKAHSILRKLKINQVDVFCGKGSNGGDGLVAARILSKIGYAVKTYLLCDRSHLNKYALHNLNKLPTAKIRVVKIVKKSDLAEFKKNFDPSIVIDAILGTGFSGKLTGDLKAVISHINTRNSPVLSVDVPSGLDATSGIARPFAVKASWTITFGLPKKGFYLNDGPIYAGRIYVRNIGFPRKFLNKAIAIDKYYEKHKSTS